MTEPKPEYLTDALEMIGIVEPKQIVTEISGFIPVFDYVVDFYKDHITALVFGRRWQYCGMEDGVCRASLSKIAKDCHLDEATVMRHTEKLVADGFLIDTTPDRRNRPHVYVDGGRVKMKSSFIAQSNTGVAQSNAGIAQSKLIKQDKTKIKQNVADATSPSPEKADREFETAMEFERMAHEGLTKGMWTGREMIPNHLLTYADWWHVQTGQTMKGKLNKEWVAAFMNWLREELSLTALQEAYDHTKGWKKIVAKPSEITAQAIAIQALPKPNEAAPVRAEGQSSGYFA